MAKKTLEKEGGIKKIKIKVLGIGGGGINIVSQIFKEIGKKVSFLVLDTDLKSLKKVPREIEKIYFGKEITRGLGTGMDLEKARIALKKDSGLIEEKIKDEDLLILVSCLGGGVSCAGSEFVLKLAKKSGILTYGIFTLPFSFEGEKKKEISQNAISSLKKTINSFSLLPNDQIFSLFPESTPLPEALSTINQKIASSLKSLLEVIFKPALINIDFADLRTIFEGRGELAYLNFEEFEENFEEKDLERLVANQFFPYTISGARKVLFNIFGGENLEISKVDLISSKIHQKASESAKIIFGVSKEKERGKIGILLLATGCKGMENFLTKEKKQKPKKEKKKIQKKEKKEAELAKQRKNGLSLQKEREKEEAEILAKEEVWQTPAFLRKGLSF
jgi:cell division protein FtsZ